jgi:DNA-binding MarR family transcriptional regulator
MDTELSTSMRKLDQHLAFASIQLHEAVARKAGLPGTDHKYLGFILEKGQMTAGELAALSNLTTGAVTGLIDRFEKKGLVKRQFAADDRRKVFIVPHTDQIMELLAPLYADYRRKMEAFSATFTPEELQVIQQYLSGAIEIMTETTSKLNNK